MSLESSYTTEIRIPMTQLTAHAANIKATPCMEILSLAMDKVVKDRGGRIDTSYTDNEGQQKACLLAIRTNDFQRGVGVMVGKDGRVTFHYDAYGDVNGTGREICEAINQNYVVIAVMRAQSKLGFNVAVKEHRQASRSKTVSVMGVR